MFTGLVVATTLSITQNNRPVPVQVIAVQLDEPSFVDVDADIVSRQSLNILETDVTPETPLIAPLETVAAIAPAIPTPEPEPAAPVTRVASVSTGPVRLGAAHRYTLPSCVDYLKTLVKITNVRFALGSDAPLDADMPRVRNIATAVETCGDVKIIVEGHSDRQGGAARNMELSQLRAQSIVDQLQKEGFDVAALQTRGFGAEQPINLSGTISGEAKNRRVQFALAPRAANPVAAPSDR